MKKLSALLLALIMVVACFAGCGEKKETYLIGCSGPLTGDASSYGISVKQGAQIAIDEINNELGGLNGVKFNFEMKDDKATAEDASTAYDSLYDMGMQVSLGSVTSGSAKAFTTKAAQDNIFCITPSASAANVIESGDCIFRVCFGDPDQGVLAAERLSAEYEKIGCIYDTSDAYSSGIYDAFDAKMKELGTEYTTQVFDKENNKDFATQVETLKDCDVIFLPIYYTEAGLIAKECEKQALKVLIFGCDGLDGVAGQIDDTVTNKISYITPFDVNSTDEKVVKFVEKYEKAYGEKPDQFAADGYDAIFTIYEAMKAGKVDDVEIEASELTDILVKTLTSDSFSYKGVTGDMTWDVSGACNKAPIIVGVN